LTAHRWKTFLLGFALAVAAGAQPHALTPLDKYVAAPDPSYGFKLVSATAGDGYTVFLLDMTSQRWRSPSKVDRTLWQHWVRIIKPERVTSSIGLLMISGGGNGGPTPPARVDRNLASLALETGSVVAELGMVPNQPLIFGEGARPRKEDTLIAYTWDKFLDTGDETWPARLPMTKSAVRAMDTVTAFCASPEGGKLRVEKFVVTGGSKHGWTTWTTAAVDSRVIAIVPIVIDMLNLEKSFDHHYRAYGFWSPATGDYVAMHIMERLGTPRLRALMKIVEPYEYRDRMTMPKFIVNSTGDPFFLPDSSRFYFDDLPGEKYLRYVPNSEHSLKGTDAWESLSAYYDSVVKGAARPKFSWKFERGGNIRVIPASRPAEVKLWRATNPKARDFRLDTLGPAWTSTPLAAGRDGSYTAGVAAPPVGWTAFLSRRRLSPIQVHHRRAGRARPVAVRLARRQARPGGVAMNRFVLHPSSPRGRPRRSPVPSWRR